MPYCEFVNSTVSTEGVSNMRLADDSCLNDNDENNDMIVA